jgi:hypothetical protein
MTTDEPKATLPSPTPVKTGEVARYAKPSCELCHGKGVLSRRAPMAVTSELSVCACAVRRFVRANPNVSVNPEGQWVWTTLAPDSPSNGPIMEIQPILEAPPKSQNAGAQSIRLGKLEALRDAAKAELDEIQDKVSGINLSIDRQILQAERQLLEHVKILADLHYERSAAETREKRGGNASEIAAEIRRLDKEVRPVSEKVDNLRQVVKDLQAQLKAASQPFRTFLRKAETRVKRLDKRINRIKAELG